ncbi:MAG: Gfo/Idh/MocA family oxidoreductase, partial [Chloroflexota bacterium]
MRVGLIGAGLQGKRRAPAVRQTHNDVVVVAAATLEAAQPLADTMGCEAVAGWEPVVARDDLDAILVCTPTYLHAPISIAALKKGVHVLCEKPLARTVEEAQAMVAAAREGGAVLKCGFNHRHHPAVQQARRWFEAGAIGEPIFARCRYGICGRPGYEKEWRASPELSGGGHLMEQGIHGIDLARWFLGDFSQATGFTDNAYWQMPVEDNAFALLRTPQGRVASIHASLTQWKNLFSFYLSG